MRKLVVELLLVEVKRVLHLRKETILEYIGLVRQCMCDASARWEAHYAQILEDHEFVQGLSLPSVFVHVGQHVDDFMVEMPTHQEKWLASVLFLKCDGKCAEKFQSDGIIAMGVSLLNRVIWWDPRPTRGTLRWCFAILDSRAKPVVTL